MDGYAVRPADVIGATRQTPVRLMVTHSLVSESSASSFLESSSAHRVQLAAPVPDGADAIVPLRHVKEEDEYLFVSAPVKSGQNIRRRAELFHAGQEVLPSGTKLNPAGIGCWLRWRYPAPMFTGSLVSLSYRRATLIRQLEIVCIWFKSIMQARG